MMLVKIDSTPLWVNPDHILALVPLSDGKTRILLTRNYADTDLLCDDVATLLATATGGRRWDP